MIKAINSGEEWHAPVRDIVAHLVGSGWSDAEILRMSAQWTKQGFTHRETFEDLCVMINGIRVKIEKAKQPTDTEQVRIDKMVSIWNRMTPEGRTFVLGLLNG